MITLTAAFLSAQSDKSATPPKKKAPLRFTDEPRASCSAIIHEGHSLRGDGLGPYRDAMNGSDVNKFLSLNLFVWKHVNELSNKPDVTANSPRERYMTFDLSRPIEGSGAVKLSSGKDYLARFHTFWKYDDPKPGTSVAKFWFMSDIPIGAVVESERVELWVLIDGVQHVLQMGPWAMGKFSKRESIDGRGTTKATIERVKDHSWRIKASDGSIARLWDYSDMWRPVDKGLYFFSFDVEFTELR